MSTQPHDDLEPRRIARSTREGMGSAKRVNIGGHGSLHSRTMGQTDQRGQTQRVQYPLPQRVVAKVRIARHSSPHKGRESLRRHLGYLTRESVTRDVGSGRFYDAKRDDINAKTETRPWRDDRHHFRLILSPEHAGELHDLSAYIRETMARIERDLGPLQWIAVNHTNTDNAHAHVLIRGRASDGNDLVIPRDYISRGIRERAAEVATRLLGERTRDEAQVALAKEAQAERFTSLDRTIARFAHPTPEGLRIDLSKVKLSRFSLISIDLLRERLTVLTQMGLAKRQRGPKYFPQRTTQTWHVASGFESRLCELGGRNDIIKHLHRTLGAAAARVATVIPGMPAESGLDSRSPSAVRGVLLGKGALDEQSDERLVVVQGQEKKPRYARVWADRSLDAIEVGGVIEVGRGTHRRWTVTRELIVVAKSSETAIYSTGGHREWLKQHHASLSGEQTERRLRTYSKSAARLARQPNSGVTHATKNSVKINVEQLERFTAKRNKWLDVRVHAVHSLESQITAKAYTWLDRQIIRTGLADRLSKNDITHTPSVRAAMTKRADWLVQHGFAERDPNGKDKHSVRFPYGATDRLRTVEAQDFARRCKDSYGKGVSLLRGRHVVPGVYHSVVYLHQGTYALVATKERFYGAPVSRAPYLEPGELVTAKVVNGRHTTWERRGPRAPQKMMGLDR